MSKIKLFLLGGISILSIGSFTSAININCSCEYLEENGTYCEGTCSSSVSLKACRAYNIDSVQTNAPDDTLVMLNVNFDDGSFGLNWGMGGMSNLGEPGLYTLNFSPSPQSFSATFDLDLTTEQELPLPEDGTIIYANFVISDGGIENSIEGCEDYVDDGTDDPDDPDVPVIPDNPDNPGDSTSLIGQLSPIILGLFDVVYQIIPYVIYIGIGILIAVLGFFAIRWLVIWISDKINSNFNSKRD